MGVSLLLSLLTHPALLHYPHLAQSHLSGRVLLAEAGQGIQVLFLHQGHQGQQDHQVLSECSCYMNLKIRYFALM